VDIQRIRDTFADAADALYKPCFIYTHCCTSVANVAARNATTIVYGFTYGTFTLLDGVLNFCIVKILFVR